LPASGSPRRLTLPDDPQYILIKGHQAVAEKMQPILL
jgi:hypothetical protein